MNEQDVKSHPHYGELAALRDALTRNDPVALARIITTHERHRNGDRHDLLLSAMKLGDLKVAAYLATVMGVNTGHVLIECLKDDNVPFESMAWALGNATRFPPMWIVLSRTPSLEFELFATCLEVGHAAAHWIKALPDERVTSWGQKFWSALSERLGLTDADEHAQRQRQVALEMLDRRTVFAHFVETIRLSAYCAKTAPVVAIELP